MLKINFSTYFLNIDGNKTNFDQLITDLNMIKHIFPGVGLAETNIDETHKNSIKQVMITHQYTNLNVDSDESTVYQIPGYTFLSR